ncbi:MAG: MATE family efflux transporter [Candidatus Loosdrechtia sp.]|uniref:MATE family efflux transporter n=1 Tax=Candidatus Loosdrechtia sp. TaxID=3101272 RepID=UPI003A7713B7|nr:MAG: MATE family efflux transporter [Candidatus Jettenia sp. AMX2]
MKLELTEKNLNKNILKLSVPIVIENVLHLGVFLSDTIMVGRLGTEAIAAVGLGGTLFYIISMVFSSFNIGAASIVARHIGAKEQEQAEMVGGQAIVISSLVSLTITPFLILFAEKILFLMSAAPDVIVPGTRFLQIVAFSLLFRLLVLTCNAILRGAGDTKTPMKINLIINSINILFNWLLIFGIGPFPRLGVPGVALATVLAYASGTGLLYSRLFAGKYTVRITPYHIIQIHINSIKRIFRVSIPAAIDAILTHTGFLFFTKIVTLLGTTALAAHQIALRVEAMSFMPGLAFAISTATLVGQSLGKKAPDLALLSMKRCCLFALIFMGSFAVVFLVFPEQIAMIFNPEPNVLLLASVCIMVAAMEQPALAIYMVFAGGLRGAGDTLSPMIVTIAGTFIFLAPMAYLFGITLGWGLAGVWLAAAIDWIGRAIAIYILFRRGRWKRIKV